MLKALVSVCAAALLPDEVEVLDSGLLAISSGPVRNPEGKVFARFTSIWRQEAPGQWKIIFDKGNPECSSTTGQRGPADARPLAAQAQ